MKRFIGLASFCALAAALTARADTTLVFNEVMYHPATNEAQMEWVELYNQMAVDLDISNWYLDGGLYYKFGSNVVVKGRGFLVVAASPATLVAATGATNVFGPFTNRLSNAGGKLLLRDNNGRVVNTLEYDTSADWPVAPDGSGVSLAKIDRNTASGAPGNWTHSAQMGGTPSKENFLVPPQVISLAFNEMSATTNSSFWLELMNYGTNSLSLTGYVIVRDGATNNNAEYVIPAGPALAAGGYLVLSNTTLGFLPATDDRLYLLPPTRTNVIDAVLLKPRARGRSPNGTGPLYHPTVQTPGASNVVVFRTEIVINEIMYHHQLLPAAATNLPPKSSPEAWVELYNKSTNTVDLTGWHLEGGITYDFLPGKTLAPGAYVVVAKDAAALAATYPAIDIVGNFSGKLAKAGDVIVLDDGNDNQADRISYFTTRAWPEYADGGGSSLELRDPKADNSRAEAWAASNESGKSVWVTNTYRALASTLVGPEQWNDFLLGFVDAGECLIDNLSVIESPTNSPVQFIANGNFESGLTGWRVLGTQNGSRVETEPGNPANHVLHVIATGVQGDLHNHIETTYTAGRSVVNGRLYEISYRAKWLAGNNLLNTRLYYDRCARTIALPTPQLNGTPGAQNSVYATNIGPTFSQFQHRAVIPAASTPVTVSVVAQDPQGVSSCDVWWSTNGGAFSSAAMTNKGGGLYVGAIPGFPAGRIVQFYVRAVDALGAAATYPAGGSNAGALYMVADGQANTNLYHNLRVIMSPANWALMRDLANPTNLMSDAFIPCTIIYDEGRAYYDVGARLKGSQSGRWYDPLPGFHLEFQPDDLFRGVHENMVLNTSGRGSSSPNKQEDSLVHHLALHAGGLPDVLRDVCKMILPSSANSGPATLHPRYEDEFVETAYDNGGDGTMFGMELNYYPTTANPAGYKLPNPQALLAVDISDLGSDKEIYRYNFGIKNHRAEDDYSRFIPICKAFSLANGPHLEAQANQVLDVNEWLRAFAFISLLGENDWYTFNNAHNLLMYIRPSDNKMQAFLWDLEHETERSSSAPLIGVDNWSDIANLTANKRRLYAHALDIIATTYKASYMTSWATHFASFAPGQNYSDLVSYAASRTTAVQSEINSAGGNSAFAVNGTNFVVTSSNLIFITGTAPVQVQSLLINGIAYPVTWSSVSSWTIRVPISAVTNALNLTAYDLNGNLLPSYSTNITVNYTGAVPNAAGSVAINEILYNPLLPDATFVEIFNASTNRSFDLSNWRVNGLGYTFPPGSIITNRQYLVLVEDQSAFINAYGTGIAPFDVFSGGLQTNGETLTLLIPATQTNLPDVVVDKIKYSPALPWPPTPPGVSLQLKAPAQDRFRLGNWAAGAGTPGASNSVTLALSAFAPLFLNELQSINLTGPTNSAGQRTPWIELYNASTNIVFLTNLYLTKTYTNLTTWALPTNASINPGQFKIIFADGLTGLSTTNEPHTSFSFVSNGFGSLALSRIANSQTQVLDFVDYTNLTPNYSFGDFPDGQVFDRQEFAYVTPRATNNGTSAPLTVAINEWMAANTHTLLNPVNNKYSDWFELHNYGTNPANLAGYYLTDTLADPLKFQIPAGYIIPPGGFLVVWADSNNTNGTPDLHANFKMSKSGESLGLYGSDGNPISFVNYGAQADDISEGRFPDGGATILAMITPTPRTNNVIPNTAPVLDAISNRLIHAGQTISLTATATDPQSPPQILTFSLDPAAPAGASIGTTSGQFVWATTNVVAPATNNITIRVADNGSPSLSNTVTFSVSVLPRPQLTTTRPTSTTLRISFSTLPGQTYQIEYKQNLPDVSWTPLNSPVPGNGSVLEVDEDLTAHAQRFYRLSVLP